ncbi:MAG: 3-keto-disaccharide hydrolase [Planctomycetota bacterium]
MALRCGIPLALALIVLVVGAWPQWAQAQTSGWICLSDDFSAWNENRGEWSIGGDARVDPNQPKQLEALPGTGVLVGMGKKKAKNLVSTQKFRDCEVWVDFLVGPGSNAGVKLNGMYEIQILDTGGKSDDTGNQTGGIYPRAEAKPKYHYLDKGAPPMVPAAKPAGEWQTLYIRFRAPRFDAAGNKTQNARFLLVALNGQVIHENAELKTPTGNWKQTEVPEGSLLLQGDHGPVAFRNVWVRPISEPTMIYASSGARGRILGRLRRW